MKTLMILVLGLLAAGCETMDRLILGPGPNGPALEEKKLMPEREQQETLVDGVVGEYELEEGGSYGKLVFLKNGIQEYYFNGKKQAEAKWSIENEEIHGVYDFGPIMVYRFNADKSITKIAAIEDGKRTDLSRENQFIWKKIK
mgnify:FL=1|jgi:hypothetical protein